MGWAHEGCPRMEEGITMLVFVGGVLTIGFHTAKFFPMLEMVPLVGKENWDGENSLGVETIGEVETNGEFLLGEARVEVWPRSGATIFWFGDHDTWATWGDEKVWYPSGVVP